MGDVRIVNFRLDSPQQILKAIGPQLPSTLKRIADQVATHARGIVPVSDRDSRPGGTDRYFRGHVRDHITTGVDASRLGAPFVGVVKADVPGSPHAFLLHVGTGAHAIHPHDTRRGLEFWWTNRNRWWIPNTGAAVHPQTPGASELRPGKIHVNHPGMAPFPFLLIAAEEMGLRMTQLGAMRGV